MEWPVEDSLLPTEGPDADITRRWSETYLDASGSDATPKRTLAKLDFTCSTRLSRTRTVVEEQMVKSCRLSVVDGREEGLNAETRRKSFFC